MYPKRADGARDQAGLADKTAVLTGVFAGTVKQTIVAAPGAGKKIILKSYKIAANSGAAVAAFINFWDSVAAAECCTGAATGIGAAGTLITTDQWQDVPGGIALSANAALQVFHTAANLSTFSITVKYSIVPSTGF